AMKLYRLLIGLCAMVSLSASSIVGAAGSHPQRPEAATPNPNYKPAYQGAKGVSRPAATIPPEQRSAEPSGAVANPNRPVTDKWALVVGISKFADPTLNLKYAAKDARDFADYLIRNEHFAADHVKVLVDEQATEKRIMSELGSKWLPHVAHPDDLV